MTARAARPSRPVGNGALLGYVAAAFLVGYGELYPFHFTPPPSLADAWAMFWSKTTIVTSSGDMLGNAVLALPLGVFGSAMLAPARGRAPLLALLFAVTLAYLFALQVAQIWFPPRDPSLADVFWHGVGLAAGIAASTAVQRGFAARTSPLLPGGALPAALLAAWVLTQLQPFLPSIDWQLIKDQIKPLLEERGIDLPRLLSVAARVAMAGWLVGLVVALPRAAHGAGLALLLAALLAAKLVIAGQGWRIETVAGYLLGWGLCVLALRLDARRGTALVCLTLLAGYTLAAMAPFEWRAYPARIHWLPFAAMLNGSIENNAWVLVESAFVFGSLLVALRRQGAALPGTTVALALWVAALEFMQRWIAGRTVDATLPMIALLMGLAVARSRPSR